MNSLDNGADRFEKQAKASIEASDAEIAKSKAVIEAEKRNIEYHEANREKNLAFLELLARYAEAMTESTPEKLGLHVEPVSTEVDGSASYESMSTRILKFFNTNLGSLPMKPSEIVTSIAAKGKEGGVRTALAELFRSGKIAREVVNGNTFAYHLESVFKDQGKAYEMFQQKKATVES